MASTRNINTPNDYCLQQRQFSQNMNYNLYKNSQYGEAAHNAIPQAGINMGHMPWNVLSRNPVQIESALFGINSTNLVKPQAPITAELNKLPTACFYDRVPTFMPEPLVVEKNQRPFPVPN